MAPPVRVIENRGKSAWIEMSEQPRYVAIRRRMNEAKVPAIYGPSADEGKG